MPSQVPSGSLGCGGESRDMTKMLRNRVLETRLSYRSICQILDQIAQEYHLQLTLDQARFVESRTALVCRIPTPSHVYGLKISAGASFENEMFFYQSLRDHSLPAPRVYTSNQIEGWSYLLIDWIDADTACSNLFDLGQQIGQVLCRVHEIAVPGVGRMQHQVWEGTDWGQFITENVDHFLRRLPELDATDKMIKLAQAGLTTLVDHCQQAQPEPRLLHSDVAIDNVIWQGDRLMVLLDPGWCIGGDPLLDVSYVLLPTTDQRLVAGFRSGYAYYDQLDQEHLDRYQVYHHVAKLMHCVETGNGARYKVWKRGLVRTLGLASEGE